MSQKNYKRGGYQKQYQTKIYIVKPTPSTEEKTNVPESGKQHAESQREADERPFETKEKDLKYRKNEKEENQAENYHEKKPSKKTAPNKPRQQEFSDKYETKNAGRGFRDQEYLHEEEFKSYRGENQEKKPHNERHYENRKYHEEEIVYFEKKKLSSKQEEEYLYYEKKQDKNLKRADYDQYPQKPQYNRGYDQHKGKQDDYYYEKEKTRGKQSAFKDPFSYDNHADDYWNEKNTTKKIRKNYNKNKNFDNYEEYDEGNKQHNSQKGYSKKQNFKKNQEYQNKKKGRREKEKIFPDFLEKSLVEEGLKNKTLYEGVFLANDSMRRLASIRCDLFEDRIFVQSLEGQNRALHSCTVAFRLLEEKSMRKNKRNRNEKQELVFVKKEELNEVESKEKSAVEIKEKKEKKQKSKENDGNESSGWETVEENEKGKKKEKVKEVSKKVEDVEHKEEKKTAEVVYILNNDYIDRDIVGKIHNNLVEEDEQGRKFDRIKKKPNFFFIPNDKKLPKMFIKDIDQPIYDMIEKDSKILDHSYFFGRLLEWPDFSYFPHIRITGYLGAEGEIENECKALLLENKVYIEDFNQKTLEHLAPYEQGEWQIPEEERKKRLDLTNKPICTVDPVTARDLDDALSIEEVAPGIYEIGVHIADVSYFVKENDPVDWEARKRTTSVYLPHRVIPMLPGILCEKLCSLNPGVERLAFSIFFKMSEDGKWLNEETPRIAKTIIKSCAKLSYDVAQLIIEGKTNAIEEFPEICKVDKTINGEKLIQGIRKMNELAQKRRAWRMTNGSLQFDKRKKRFILNEKNIPTSFTVEERKEANFMVEEYMLLANIIAGVTMVKNCREVALLRKHDAPQEKKVKNLRTFLESLNIKNMNTEDIFTIFDSLEKLKNDKALSDEMLQTIDQKLIRVMQLARYFIVNDSDENNWHHFALNFDVYTHFTSPIRRYPDVLVHRLLFNIIEYGEDARAHTNKESMIEIMNRCNECKQASRKVSDGCEKIFSCLCMKANQQEFYTKAIVLSFGRSGMSISVPAFDLVDLKINFKEVKQIKDVKVEENPLRKLVLKISNKIRLDENGKPIKRKKHEHDDDADDDFFLKKLEYLLFQDITVKLGVKNVFPIDYQVYLTVNISKTGLEKWEAIV